MQVSEIKQKAFESLNKGIQVPFEIVHEQITYAIVEFADETFFDCNEIAGFDWNDQFLAVIAPENLVCDDKSRSWCDSL